MPLTQGEKNEFRSAVNRFEFEAEDERVRQLVANPRILKALANGQLDRFLATGYVPIEEPPSVKNLMQEAQARRLIELGAVTVQLLDHEVDVDYGRTEDGATFGAGILHHRGDKPEFENWSAANHARRKLGGMVRRRLRKIRIDGETTLHEVVNLIEMYGFGLTEPRTLAALVERCPSTLDDGLALTATLPLKHERGRSKASPCPCLYYVEKIRQMTGIEFRRFNLDEPGECVPTRLGRYAFLVETTETIKP